MPKFLRLRIEQPEQRRVSSILRRTRQMRARRVQIEWTASKTESKDTGGGSVDGEGTQVEGQAMDKDVDLCSRYLGPNVEHQVWSGLVCSGCIVTLATRRRIWNWSSVQDGEGSGDDGLRRKIREESKREASVSSARRGRCETMLSQDGASGSGRGRGEVTLDTNLVVRNVRVRCG